MHLPYYICNVIYICNDYLVIIFHGYIKFYIHKVFYTYTARRTKWYIRSINLDPYFNKNVNFSTMCQLLRQYLRIIVIIVGVNISVHAQIPSIYTICNLVYDVVAKRCLYREDEFYKCIEICKVSLANRYTAAPRHLSNFKENRCKFRVNEQNGPDPRTVRNSSRLM